MSVESRMWDYRRGYGRPMKSSSGATIAILVASALAAVIGIGLFVWSQVPRHNSVDQTYLDGLHDAGVEGVSDDVLIDQAHRICVDLKSGVYVFSVASRLSKVNPSQTVDQALLQVGTAVGSYCREQRANLDGW